MGIYHRGTRREFLSRAAAVGAGALVVGCKGSAKGMGAEVKAPDTAEVTPAEDLMFEHGVVERMLLIYNEAADRIDAGKDVPPTAIADMARLSREFVEDYHARTLEEKQVFPRFEKAGRHVELVKTLTAQHEAGRTVTDRIMQLTRNGSVSEPQRLAAAMRSYHRMYAPHAAREETVLFKAFQGMLPAEAYRELGEQFEKKEHELFGEGGFQAVVERVAAAEKQLGIHDLGRFTPA